MPRKNNHQKYDGATINGRPTLNVSEVQNWFAHEGCTIPSDDAEALARDLNHCALMSFCWRNTPELRTSRRDNQSRQSMKRIDVALQTLQTELPILIANIRRIFPDGHFLSPIEALLKSANDLEPEFRRYASRGGGRPSVLWHNIARNIGRNISKALVQHSGKRRGIGRPTSPAIRILKSALAFLGEVHSEDTIVEAVRPRRTRRKKRKYKAVRRKGAGEMGI